MLHDSFDRRLSLTERRCADGIFASPFALGRGSGTPFITASDEYVMLGTRNDPCGVVSVSPVPRGDGDPITG
jgi:hypothetical protein